jgi:hypothetical protein
MIALGLARAAPLRASADQCARLCLCPDVSSLSCVYACVRSRLLDLCCCRCDSAGGALAVESAAAAHPNGQRHISTCLPHTPTSVHLLPRHARYAHHRHTCSSPDRVRALIVMSRPPSRTAAAATAGLHDRRHAHAGASFAPRTGAHISLVDSDADSEEVPIVTPSRMPSPPMVDVDPPSASQQQRAIDASIAAIVPTMPLTRTLDEVSRAAALHVQVAQDEAMEKVRENKARQVRCESTPDRQAAVVERRSELSADVTRQQR